VPSFLQACAPVVPPGQAHDTCIPGIHTMPPVEEDVVEDVDEEAPPEPPLDAT
jgi:hypothetical protein